MEESRDIQPVPLFYSGEGITLPLNEEDFKDFMVSLLGKPELVEGHVEGAFSLGFEAVQNLNYQIDNRILQQNQATPLQFTAKLYFDNNSSLSFKSFDGFRQYKESRPIICTGFDFTWVYLIKFGGKNVFEKQEIRIFANRPVEPSEGKKSSRRLATFILEKFVEMPRVHYEIRCTANTWGFEIAELIRNLLLDATVQTKDFIRFRKFISDQFPPLYFTVFIGLFLFLYWFQAAEFREVAQEASFLIEQGTEPAEVINYIFDLLRIDLQLNSIASAAQNLFVSLVFSGVLCFCILEIVKLPNYIFLLFTSKSIRGRDTYFERVRKRKITAVFGVVLSVGLGVLSNYAFEYIKNN